MIHQLQYRFPKDVKPTAANLFIERSRWLQGKPPFHAGVKVRAISWSGQDTRAAVSRGYIGRAGIVKVYGRPNLTLCDYDTPGPPSWQSITRVARMLGIQPAFTRYDRTARGWHVVIEWNRTFRPLEIICLQFALGSDPKRETYNLARVFSGKRSKRWNLLFWRKIT